MADKNPAPKSKGRALGAVTWVRAPDGACTPHFDWDEIACRHCHKVPSIAIARTTAEWLEKIRIRIRGPMIVHSCCRCPAHNKAVGGAANSYHVKGFACDWEPAEISLITAYEILKGLHGLGGLIGGLGRYDTFFHTDRGPHRFWDLRTGVK